MKILICYGTRPEYIKIKPLLKESSKYDTLFITQHKDTIKDHNPSYIIEIKEDFNRNRLNSIFAQIFEKSEEILKNYSHILIQGDTATVAAISISAFNLKKQVIHLEAGLRSFDLENPYPEEAYRQIVSRITSINLCPTKLSKQNLINEKVNGKIYVVGNTVLDNILHLKKETNYLDKVLITLHRNENLPIIKDWFNEIEKLAKKFQNIEFILPIHPNPIIKEAAKIFKYVKIIDPLNHEDLLQILKDSKCIISDSGGIQEEGSLLNKKIIVCRKTTERPEGIESGHLKLCNSPEKLNKIFEKIIKNYKINCACPYGNGSSARKIAKILKKYE